MTVTRPTDASRPGGRRSAPFVVSVNVGMPKPVAWQDRTVFTGIWKRSVPGPQMVRRLNIDGDGQGDTAGHGGEHRAVLVYQMESYAYWEKYFRRTDFTYGQFGENLTVEGLPDDEVCIGDRYRIGEAEFEVTQPRVTCYRVGLRLNEPEMASLLVRHRRPGFYLRVLTEGHVEAGDEIIKTLSGPGSLSVVDVDALLYLPPPDLAKLRVAVQIPALSPGWLQSFTDLITTSERATDTTMASGPTEPAWSGFRKLRVSAVVAETATVASIYLTDPDGSRLPRARAGQYLTLRIDDAGKPAPVRSYSLSSDPDGDHYRISVKQEPGGIASSFLTQKLRPGASIDVAAPRGEFVLEGGESPLVLVSAGIGVTPVLALLHELKGQRSNRDLWWIHAARGPAEHALAFEAHEILRSLPRAKELIFYSAATADETRHAGARQGRLNRSELAGLDLPREAEVYVCGPPSFIVDIRDALTSLGLESSQIHVELFGALPSINPGVVGQTRAQPHPPSAMLGTGPLVSFARSGLTVRFDPTKRSLLELAEACDISTRWACRTGVCHTCSTPLLAGTISYQPDPLEDPADGEVLVCCARPEDDIVLEM